jgi:methyl-accepting chemotaxis protein
MQSKFAGTILLLAFLVAIITACNIYVLGSFFFSAKATQFEQKNMMTIMQHFFSEFWPRLLLLVFVNVIIIFIVSVMYSHQTAGPAYKLEKSIRRISEGDLTFQVSLRRNDNLKELAAALNDVTSKFRETLAKAKTLSEDISSKLESVDGDEGFKVLAKNAAELRELIDRFKIAKDKKKPEESESEPESEEPTEETV